MSWNDFDQNEITPAGQYTSALFNSSLDETGDYPVLKLQFKSPKVSGLMFMDLRFNDKGQKFAKWQMSAMGMSDNVKAKLTETSTASDAARAALDATTPLLGNAKFEIEVKHNEYNGKTYANPIVLGLSEGSELDTTDETETSFDSNEEIPF